MERRPRAVGLCVLCPSVPIAVLYGRSVRTCARHTETVDKEESCQSALFVCREAREAKGLTAKRTLTGQAERKNTYHAQDEENLRAVQILQVRCKSSLSLASTGANESSAMRAIPAKSAKRLQATPGRFGSLALGNILKTRVLYVAVRMLHTLHHIVPVTNSSKR
jgi:hypothetical protein